jgi:predicted permease
MWLRLIGRIRGGVPAELAQERTIDLFHQLVEEEAGAGLTTAAREAIAKLKTALVPFAGGFTHMRQRWEKPLLVLMTVVGLVLLIVCANVGNLLLARGAGRQREMAMRLALGAGRLRLIRQLLTESALLAAFGGALALVVAQWTIRFLLGLLTPQGADALDTGLDGRVLLVTMGLAALTVLIFGVVPAVRATRVEINPALRRQSGMASADRRGGRLRKTLVIFQVAVSLCLLIGAGLLVRSLGNLRGQDMGFRPEGVVLIDIDPQGGGFAEARLPALHRGLLDRITALPDVSAAGLSQYSLLGRARRIEVASVDGYEAKPDDDAQVQALIVTPRYFEAIGASLVAGRPFDDQDQPGGPEVAIVSESFARHFLGGQPAVGRRFGLDGPQSSRSIEIVGTVRDIKATDLRAEAPRLIYRPAAQMPTYLNSIVVRCRRDPAAMVPRLRQILADVAPDLPVTDVTPLTARIDVALRDERMLSQLSGLFGLLALLLASIGLHGVLAYGVVQRTGEIGLRMALGAGRPQVLWMILRDGLAWVGIGAAIGLLASLVFGRLLASLLFGLGPIDPVTILGAVATLVGVACAAAFWPARRASRLDPFTALRAE